MEDIVMELLMNIEATEAIQKLIANYAERGTKKEMELNNLVKLEIGSLNWEQNFRDARLERSIPNEIFDRITDEPATEKSRIEIFEREIENEKRCVVNNLSSSQVF